MEELTLGYIPVHDERISRRSKIEGLITMEEYLIKVKKEENANIPKIYRESIYTYNFDVWNGFLFFDIDIRDKQKPELVNIMKKHLFDNLKKFKWFVSIALSSNGKGLHIVTNVKKDENVDEETYYSLVYVTERQIIKELLFEISVEYCGHKTHANHWMDSITKFMRHNLFITNDKNIMINDNFANKTYEYIELTDYTKKLFECNHYVDIAKVIELNKKYKNNG